MFKNTPIKMQVFLILSKYKWKPKQKISREKTKTVKESSREVIPHKEKN